MDKEVSSLLSRTQRQWLRGNGGKSPDRTYKSRIKYRYMQALRDLELLCESDKITIETIADWNKELRDGTED